MEGDLLDIREEELAGFLRHGTRLFSASLFGRIKVLAWSTNLQSSYGVTKEFREELPKRLVALATRSGTAPPFISLA
jgi:hypothetical protein